MERKRDRSPSVEQRTTDDYYYYIFGVQSPQPISKWRIAWCTKKGGMPSQGEKLDWSSDCYEKSSMCKGGVGEPVQDVMHMIMNRQDKFRTPRSIVLCQDREYRLQFVQCGWIWAYQTDSYSQNSLDIEPHDQGSIFFGQNLSEDNL